MPRFLHRPTPRVLQRPIFYAVSERAREHSGAPLFAFPATFWLYASYARPHVALEFNHLHTMLVSATAFDRIHLSLSLSPDSSNPQRHTRRPDYRVDSVAKRDHALFGSGILIFLYDLALRTHCPLPLLAHLGKELLGRLSSSSSPPQSSVSVSKSSLHILGPGGAACRAPRY